MHPIEEEYFTHAGHSLPDYTDVFGSLLKLRTGSPLFDQLPDREALPASDQPFPLPILDEDLPQSRVANKRVEAGWTYFGQLMAHDLTMRRDINGMRPRLNLECLYGYGPRTNAHLYEFYFNELDGYRFRGVRFALDYYAGPNGPVNDVLRSGKAANIPLMGDARNDDNFILSQLHCALLQFHNRMAEYFQRHDLALPAELFQHTRQFVTWTYQWLIINEYLPKLTGALANDLITGQEPYRILKDVFNSTEGPILMPEFIIAAFRMGHSQVRDNYTINNINGSMPLYRKDKLDLRGFSRNEKRGSIEWPFFFDFGNSQVQNSRPIDFLIAASMHNLPFLPKNDHSLPQINIRRSLDKKLFLRQEDLSILRDELGIATCASFQSAIQKLYPQGWCAWHSTYKKAFEELQDWPLWLFILLEARAEGTSEMAASKSIEQKLGPLGAQIIAEQLTWVLTKDPDSYLNKKPSSQRPWQPTDQIPTDYHFINPGPQHRFSMADVLYIAEHGL